MTLHHETCWFIAGKVFALCLCLFYWTFCYDNPVSDDENDELIGILSHCLSTSYMPRPRGGRLSLESDSHRALHLSATLSICPGVTYLEHT